MSRRSHDTRIPEQHHPPDPQLLDFISGRWDGGSRQTVAEHVARCAPCGARIQALGTLLRAAEGTGLEPLPPHLLRRAVAMFDSWRGGGREASSFGLASLARGTFGTLRLRFGWPARGGALIAAPVSLRSASLPPRCELAGGGYRIEVEWARSGRSSMLRGRVVSEGRGTEPAPALLLEFPDHTLRRMSLGPRGFFGPALTPAPRFRAVLATARKAYRSGWVDLS